MGKVSGPDYEKILSVLREIHSMCEPSEFSKRLLVSLLEVIPADSASMTEVDPVLGKSSGYSHPPHLSGWIGIEERFQRNITDHPVVAYALKTRDGSAKAISDFLTAKQFEATGMYREVFEPMKLVDQLSIGMVGSAGLLIGICINRSVRGFSERDRALLDVLRPHILQAYLNCRERAATRDRSTDRYAVILNRLPLGLACVNADGRVAWMTDAARQLLHAHYPDAAESIHGLPDTVRQWLKRVSKASGGGMVEKSNKLISRLSDRELQIRHCPLEDKRAILLCQEISTQLKSPIMTEHGFTPREQEVAMQIVDGNPVQAVAATLSMSPRTLQKHLERIFRKLNVNNLAAACVKLMRADG